jgi:pimeloyl-ACP methyl ester carboxylesterase
VALWLAAAMPERVLGCVCVDGGAAAIREHLPTWAEAEERLRPPRLSGITGERVRGWAAAGPLAEGGGAGAAEQILLGNFEPAGDGTLRPRLRLDHHMKIVRGLWELDAFELMGRVRCPVLFLAARGGMWPADAKAEGLSRAEAVLGERSRVVWVDGGHDLPVQRPVEVAEAIAEFVAEVALAG